MLLNELASLPFRLKFGRVVEKSKLHCISAILFDHFQNWLIYCQNKKGISSIETQCKVNSDCWLHRLCSQSTVFRSSCTSLTLEIFFRHSISFIHCLLEWIKSRVNHHHHLFFLPCSARVRRLPRYENSPHISEHYPFRLQTKQFHVIIYTLSKFSCPNISIVVVVIIMNSSKLVHGNFIIMLILGSIVHSDISVRTAL